MKQLPVVSMKKISDKVRRVLRRFRRHGRPSSLPSYLQRDIGQPHKPDRPRHWADLTPDGLSHRMIEQSQWVISSGEIEFAMVWNAAFSSAMFLVGK